MESWITWKDLTAAFILMCGSGFSSFQMLIFEEELRFINFVPREMNK